MLDNLFDYVVNNPAETIAFVISAATFITMLTPTSVDNKYLDKILQLVNALAGNVLKNTNADDKRSAVTRRDEDAK